jgi:outer membrane assembly lipoprotein YfiO
MRRIAFAFLTALAVAGVPRAAQAEPKEWDFGGGGKWTPVQPSATTRPINNPTLDQAEQLLSAGHETEARRLLVSWVKTPGNQAAPDRDRALFLLADAYFREDDLLTSFYQYDELLDNYPESRFFNPALERQFTIADKYLNGHKDKFLGIRLLSQEDKAIDMLFRIRERAPGSPLAERALMRTAEYYFSTAQYDFAGDAYAAFARAYPRSPELGTVRLRQAFSSLAQFRGIKFDSTPLIDARTQFQDLQVRYPEIAKQAETTKFVDTINHTLAKKMLDMADFYRRTSRPKAAAYTLFTLIETYPNTAESDSARTALNRLPKAEVEAAKKARPAALMTQPYRMPTGPATPEGPARPGVQTPPATRPF